MAHPHFYFCKDDHDDDVDGFVFYMTTILIFFLNKKTGRQTGDKTENQKMMMAKKLYTQHSSYSKDKNPISKIIQ